MTQKVKGFAVAFGYLVAASFMASCSSEERGLVVPEEYGTLRLSVATGDSFESSRSRAVDESLYHDIKNYKVSISQDGNVIQEFASASELPNSMELANGSYTINASYGTPHAKSRDEFYSGDHKVVSLQGDTQTATLVCTPTCAKVKVKFDDTMSQYFTDYRVDFSTEALAEDKAGWSATDTEPWYLLVKPNGEEVKATISLTPKKEYNIKASTIERSYKLKPNQGWTLNIAPNYSSNDSKLGVEITIDSSTNDTSVEIVVPSDWVTKQ